jgi:hypothetical protein
MNERTDGRIFRIIRWKTLLDQEMLTLPDHLKTPAAY